MRLGACGPNTKDSWPIGRIEGDQRTMEIHAHFDEDEYLAMKVRLLETLERGLTKNAGDAGSS